MKGALSALDLHYLSQELRVLVGTRLDKAYQHNEERRDLLLQFRGKEKLMLRALLPGALYLAEHKPRYGKMPGYFAVFLRKHIGNARCIGVAQRGFDRVLELRFENKNGVFTLVLEFLPPGNALLLNNAGKIINLLEPKRLSARTLRGGALYEPPPAQFNTRDASEEEIVQQLSLSTKNLVRSLATKLGLGGEYAEECCARNGFPKDAERLSPQELRAVAVGVRELFTITPDARASDAEATPFPFVSKELPEKHPSFSHAIEHVVTLGEDREEEAVVERMAAARRSKAAEVIAQQRAALTALNRSAEENQRKGELLYEHYQAVESLLNEINELRKHHDWKTIKERLKGRAQIDEAKGCVTIDLE